MVMVNESELLVAAAAYAAKGWAVFPCQPRGKEPATAHGHREATTDECQIREWWAHLPNANIGLACGASGLAVIDVDVHPDRNTDGWPAWRALCQQHGLVTHTVQAVTSNGGRHFLYAVPPGMKVQGANGKLGPGLDLKANGGYILVAPSVHPSGATYQWAPGLGPDEVPLAPLPTRSWSC